MPIGSRASSARCVLYEMLTGTRAFRGDTVSDVVAAVIGSEPDWQRLPAATPPLVRRLLPRLLAKDPRRRVRDIMDARVDLEDADAHRRALFDPDANGRAATRILDASADPMWTFVSRDGRTLLYNNAVVGSRNLWTLPLDGSTRPRQITTIAGHSVMHSSLSPDGTRVAFASNPTGQTDIWVQNVDGSDLRRLTNDAGADAWPAWTPDGRSIVFSAQDATETRIVPATGGASEKLLDGFFRGDLVEMPGGGLLMATTQTGGGLRLIEVGTRKVLWEARPLGNAMPSFSPDGTLISHPYRERRDRDAIWLYETATGKSRVAVRFPESFLIVLQGELD
jgi:hypothetical protein